MRHRQKSAGHRRQCAQHGDDAAGRNGAGTDVAHVTGPDLVRRHVGHEPRGLGREWRDQRRAGERNDGRQHDCREERSGDEHAGLLVAKDEAYAEESGREFERQLRLGDDRQQRVHVAGCQKQERDRKLDGSAERNAPEDPRTRG